MLMRPATRGDLAWLLGCADRARDRPQGNLGFKLFIEEFGNELGVESNPRVKNYAEEPDYWVHREVSGAESRVDIEIAVA